MKFLMVVAPLMLCAILLTMFLANAVVFVCVEGYAFAKRGRKK